MHHVTPTWPRSEVATPAARRAAADCGGVVGGQRAIERQERLIALTAELKKALMHKLFTEGTRGEPPEADRDRAGAGELADRAPGSNRDDRAGKGPSAPPAQCARVSTAAISPSCRPATSATAMGGFDGYTQTLNERGLAISRIFHSRDDPDHHRREHWLTRRIWSSTRRALTVLCAITPHATSDHGFLNLLSANTAASHGPARSPKGPRRTSTFSCSSHGRSRALD